MVMLRAVQLDHLRMGRRSTGEEGRKAEGARETRNINITEKKAATRGVDKGRFMRACEARARSLSCDIGYGRACWVLVEIQRSEPNVCAYLTAMSVAKGWKSLGVAKVRTRLVG